MCSSDQTRHLGCSARMNTLNRKEDESTEVKSDDFLKLLYFPPLSLFSLGLFFPLSLLSSLFLVDGDGKRNEERCTELHMELKMNSMFIINRETFFSIFLSPLPLLNEIAPICINKEKEKERDGERERENARTRIAWDVFAINGRLVRPKLSFFFLSK